MNLILIEKFLTGFRGCFQHQMAFNWFLVIILGLIVRSDHLGISSFVRCFYFESKAYYSLLYFFRSSAWSLSDLLDRWVEIVCNRFPVLYINNRPILVGDGIKVCKEAQKMPGVKKLHQESANSGKGETIFGHHIGSVGIIIGNIKKIFCVPLQSRIHEGVDEIRFVEKINNENPTLVTKMAQLVVETAISTNKLCYIALDAYFAVSPAFMYFKNAVNKKNEQLVHIITRAKKNYVGFHDGLYSDKKFHKENKVILKEMFDFQDCFETVELKMYSEMKTIKYLYLDLLWKPIEDLVRFVLIIDGNDEYILMCSDLKLSPEDIITIYSYRCKIELSFKFLKHIFGGFYYHFWTKVCPRLENGTIDLTNLSDDDLKIIESTVEANERFINLSGIAMGILQYIAILHPSKVWDNYYGWLRTKSSEIPSEATVQQVIQFEFNANIWKVPFCNTLQFIQSKIRNCLWGECIPLIVEGKE